MKNRLSVVGVVVLSLAAAGLAPAKKAAAPAPGSGIEKRLGVFANQYLPFDPDSRLAIQKSDLKLPGFTSWKINRTGRYPSLNAEATVFVSNDGKWFYEGDSYLNRSPKPARTPADLDWVTARYSSLLRTNVRAQFVPERDAAGLKGMAVIIETGFGAVRLPGLVTPDGSVFLGGTLWDFQGDPRAERRRRIDVSASSGDRVPEHLRRPHAHLA